MDNEMIDRVIKASFDCWNNRRGLNYTVVDLSDDEKEFARLHAIAIIKAMREPTEKMAYEGCKELPDYDPSSDDAIRCWQNMIDAVLNETPI